MEQFSKTSHRCTSRRKRVFKHRCHVRIRSKWRHIFSIFLTAAGFEGKFLSSFPYLLMSSLTIFGSAGIWADILCPASQWKCWKCDIRSSVFNKCICVCVKQINSIFDLSFYCYLVSYNTTGVLHSSDKMTECELTLAGWFEMRALPLPIKTPPYIYIYIFIKNWTTDIRFPAFSLPRRTQVISSYTCTTKYGQWKHQ